MKCKDTKSEIGRLKRRVAYLEAQDRPPVTAMGLLRFLAFAGSMGLVILSINATIWSWEWLSIPSEVYDYLPQHMLILGPVFLTYLSACLAAITGCVWVKRGYTRLKPVNNEGLIDGLIIGLIIGLITGLIDGLITGLIDGLMGGLIGGLMGGLIIGLIIGLIGGLIIGLIIGLIGGLAVGLITGLIKEFDWDEPPRTPYPKG
jgi:hypothetical protein